MKNIYTKKKMLVSNGIFVLLIGLNGSLFAANDSSASFIPDTTPRKQYLLVDSQNPSSNMPSTYGASNVNAVCGQDEQMVGVIETNRGANLDPGNQPFARQFFYLDNYVFVPRCTNPSIWTGECGRDWVQQYTEIDTLQVICAKNSLHWEDKRDEHTTTPDPNAVSIGSYVAPP